MTDSRSVEYGDLERLLRTHGQMVVCTVVRAQGSVPRRVGARMVVLPNGQIQGTIGGGLFEARVTADAQATLAARQSGVKHYDFRPVGASPDAFGAVCGGQVDVFLEVATQGDSLLIVGGGHCGRALARAAVRLGDFRVTLVDDRPDHAVRGDLPEGIALAVSAPDFSDLPARVEPGAFVVLVSQGFMTDQAALRRTIGMDTAYIGMMGSRKKVRTVLEALQAEGIDPERLAAVHAPIGLPIHAESPEEIAVSILAQLIDVRAAKRARANTVGATSEVILISSEDGL